MADDAEDMPLTGTAAGGSSSPTGHSSDSMSSLPEDSWWIIPPGPTEPPTMVQPEALEPRALAPASRGRRRRLLVAAVAVVVGAALLLGGGIALRHLKPSAEPAPSTSAQPTGNATVSAGAPAKSTSPSATTPSPTAGNPTSVPAQLRPGILAAALKKQHMTCGVEHTQAPYLVGCYDDDAESYLEWEGSGDAPISIEGWIAAPLHSTRHLAPILEVLRGKLHLLDRDDVDWTLGAAKDATSAPTIKFSSTASVRVSWNDDSLWLRVDRIGAARTRMAARELAKDGTALEQWLKPKGYACSTFKLGDGWADVECIIGNSSIGARHYKGIITSVWGGWYAASGRQTILPVVTTLLGAKATAAWRPGPGSPSFVRGVDGFVVRCGQDDDWSYCSAVVLSWDR